MTEAPALRLFLTEPGRGAVRLGAFPLTAPFLAGAPRGEPHGVLFLPGLLTTDSSTLLLRRFVKRLGHTPWGWRLGRNLGPTRGIVDGLPRALALLAERTGEPVSLVGWSLGGIFARELARKQPELVRQVITLGSPFAMTSAQQSRVDRAFRSQARKHVTTVRLDGRPRPLPVPTTSVYSKRDGIVHWRSCVEPEAPGHQNVEVRCAHLGFGADPATFWVVADRLAQAEPGHAPFVPPPRLRRLFP